MSAADGNCSVTCGAASYIISQWVMELQRATYEELKFDFGTGPKPKSPAAVATPEPEPGGFLVPALAQEVISQRARVSPSVATPMCDRFSFPQVPQGQRHINRLPPIILIGGAAGRNTKYGTVQPIGSTSATGVTVWGTDPAEIYWFSNAVRLKLFICLHHSIRFAIILFTWWKILLWLSIEKDPLHFMNYICILKQGGATIQNKINP